MIEDIRKKHEAWKTMIEEDNEDLNLYRSALSISDVDALFAALDDERAKVEKVREWADKFILSHPFRSDLEHLRKAIIGEGKK